MTRIDPARVILAEKLLGMHLPSSQIVRELMEKFRVREPAARGYLHLAWKAIHNSDAEDASRRKIRMRRTLAFLMGRAVAKNDFNACAKFTDQLCKLDGLYAPARVQAATGILPACGTPTSTTRTAGARSHTSHPTARCRSGRTSR